jgi:hypothetical protein
MNQSIFIQILLSLTILIFLILAFYQWSYFKGYEAGLEDGFKHFRRRKLRGLE